MSFGYPFHPKNNASTVIKFSPTKNDCLAHSPHIDIFAHRTTLSAILAVY